jgi:hypothetical protein
MTAVGDYLPLAPSFCIAATAFFTFVGVRTLPGRVV